METDFDSDSSSKITWELHNPSPITGEHFDQFLILTDPEQSPDEIVRSWEILRKQTEDYFPDSTPTNLNQIFCDLLRMQVLIYPVTEDWKRPLNRQEWKHCEEQVQQALQQIERIKKMSILLRKKEPTAYPTIAGLFNQLFQYNELLREEWNTFRSDWRTYQKEWEYLYLIQQQKEQPQKQQADIQEVETPQQEVETPQKEQPQKQQAGIQGSRNATKYAREETQKNSYRSSTSTNPRTSSSLRAGTLACSLDDAFGLRKRDSIPLSTLSQKYRELFRKPRSGYCICWCSKYEKLIRKHKDLSYWIKSKLCSVGMLN